MPLYLEKAPIMIIGMGTPFLIGNMMAHRLIDDDSSRIMLLSTVGAELNTVQHFGHNSRIINIRGRINMTTGNEFNLGMLNTEALFTGLRVLKETKSAVLVIMNHSICYGVIRKINIIDDRELPTAFDYECEIIEKDMYGLKFSAISQRLFSGLVTGLIANIDRKRFIQPETVIPSFEDIQE